MSSKVGSYQSINSPFVPIVAKESMFRGKDSKKAVEEN
jgi:hypothetical protein